MDDLLLGAVVGAVLATMYCVHHYRGRLTRAEWEQDLEDRIRLARLASKVPEQYTPEEWAALTGYYQSVVDDLQAAGFNDTPRVGADLAQVYRRYTGKPLPPPPVEIRTGVNVPDGP